MASSKDFTVAIVGGGIAGLTLAIALRARNINVTVYERAAAFGEIGAGVSFTPNAVEAMKVCHAGVYDAFERVCTLVTSPAKREAGVFFDYVKGYDPSLGPGEMPKIEFTLRSAYGQNAVHRAHFLDELVKLLPADIARFGKGLVSVAEVGEEAEMRFEDGSTARADVVIGCDGIKSRVRRSMFGDDAPCAYPSYTHKYAYRGLIPIEKAKAALGDDLGSNAFMHVGSRDNGADLSSGRTGISSRSPSRTARRSTSSRSTRTTASGPTRSASPGRARARRPSRTLRAGARPCRLCSPCATRPSVW